eukprot:3307231-Rhodomonas_salina.1
MFPLTTKLETERREQLSGLPAQPLSGLLSSYALAAPSPALTARILLPAPVEVRRRCGRDGRGGVLSPYAPAMRCPAIPGTDIALAPPARLYGVRYRHTYGTDITM